MTVERLKITSQETKALRGLVKTQEAGIERGRFAKKFPTLEGRGVQTMQPRIINVSFDVTQEVAAALRALRDTGLFGNGVDCASVAEDLLRSALRDPEVAAYWQAPQVGRLRFDPPTPALRDLLRRSAAKLHRKKTSP